MSNTEPKSSDEAKEKGGRKKALIICILIIIALLGVVAYLLFSNKDGEEKKRNVVVNEDNVEELIAQMEESERTPLGSYEMTMNSTWNFDNGTAASSNAYVENSVANANSVYFDVTLADTNETILESPILPVGSHLTDISLEKSLEAGTYDCIMTYHLLDENDVSISTVKVSLTIVIEN